LADSVHGPPYSVSRASSRRYLIEIRLTTLSCASISTTFQHQIGPRWCLPSLAPVQLANTDNFLNLRIEIGSPQHRGLGFDTRQHPQPKTAPMPLTMGVGCRPTCIGVCDFDARLGRCRSVRTVCDRYSQRFTGGRCLCCGNHAELLSNAFDPHFRKV